MYLTLVPAYGRDYTSAKAVREAWAAGKDFQICDMSSRYDGAKINKDNDAPAGTKFQIRYKKLTQICTIPK